mmetsp:Transcript_35215/g.93291  ORF Transcript_35215/g.93291 Transcript_35215/m.93291 type:complete len:205 (-) Transcript_35215:102-716(-)
MWVDWMLQPLSMRARSQSFTPDSSGLRKSGQSCCRNSNVKYHIVARRFPPRSNAMSSLDWFLCAASFRDAYWRGPWWGSRGCGTSSSQASMAPSKCMILGGSPPSGSWRLGFFPPPLRPTAAASSGGLMAQENTPSAWRIRRKTSTHCDEEMIRGSGSRPRSLAGSYPPSLATDSSLASLPAPSPPDSIVVSLSRRLPASGCAS